MTDFDNDFDKDAYRDSLKQDIRDRIRDRDRIHDEIRERRREIRDLRKRQRGTHQHSPAQGAIFGGIVCLVGVLLLLDHLGFISVDHLWRFWPVIPMAIGAAHLTEPGRRQWGAIVLLVGTLFLLDSLGILHFHWSELWPLVIIGVGGVMIWNSIAGQRRRGAIPDSEAMMNAHAIFSGIERRITAKDFRFGRVSAVFGGVELDFHEADIDGDRAELEVNAIFGGAEIRVPEHWRVEAQNQVVFGGLSDETRTANRKDDTTTPGTKVLIISGTITFGGVEVKN
jgi:predicted membrane protein